MREGRQLLGDLGLGNAYSRGEVQSALYLVYLVVLKTLYFNIFQILITLGGTLTYVSFKMITLHLTGSVPEVYRPTSLSVLFQQNCKFILSWIIVPFCRTKQSSCFYYLLECIVYQ